MMRQAHVDHCFRWVALRVLPTSLNVGLWFVRGKREELRTVPWQALPGGTFVEMGEAGMIWDDRCLFVFVLCCFVASFQGGHVVIANFVVSLQGSPEHRRQSTASLP